MSVSLERHSNLRPFTYTVHMMQNRAVNLFVPGFRFRVQQASLTKKPRKYTIVFELDNECRPIRVGGVKPTFNTMEMVNRIVARRYGGVVT